MYCGNAWNLLSASRGTLLCQSQFFSSKGFACFRANPGDNVSHPISTLASKDSNAKCVFAQISGKLTALIGLSYGSRRLVRSLLCTSAHKGGNLDVAGRSL